MPALSRLRARVAAAALLAGALAAPHTPRTTLVTATIATTASPAAIESLVIGARPVGITFGNARRAVGLRINLRDEGVRRVDGINLTLWIPRSNPDAVVNGAAIGLVGPAAGRSTGSPRGSSAWSPSAASPARTSRGSASSPRAT
jgi:hypothetical protein